MRKALIIGINNYKNSPLKGCINDAVSISSVLEKNGDGSPNFQVRLITDPGISITRSFLRESIEKLFDGKESVALLYFSGHGLIKSTGGYIVTPDYKKYDEGISMDDILAIANKSKIRDKIIILDCCYSGAFGSPTLSGSETAILGDGVTILTACRDSEAAIEVNGHGLFTSLLLDGLQGGASDLRGNISPGSLYSYVDEALGPWEQRPIFKTNVSRFMALRQTVPYIAIDVLRRITEYFPTPDYEHQLDPSYEFTSQHPDEKKVNIFKHLQKFESVNLVKPVGEDHMYFAAMNSKTCKLTALGYQYWRLVYENKI